MLQGLSHRLNNLAVYFEKVQYLLDHIGVIYVEKVGLLTNYLLLYIGKNRRVI